MRPTEVLENEHRIIKQVLSCLEKMTELNEKSKALDCEAARDMIEFFRMFADRFHHAKEEQHLFGLLETHGMPRDGGPTGVMLAEHEMGRSFVAKMEQAVAVYEKGDSKALNDFARAARSYVLLLREHIQKEDHCLFAMTNQALSDAEQESLLEAFRLEEEKQSQEKPLDYYLVQARKLGAKFHVLLQGAPTGAFSFCAGSCGGH